MKLLQQVFLIIFLMAVSLFFAQFRRKFHMNWSLCWYLIMKRRQLMGLMMWYFGYIHARIGLYGKISDVDFDQGVGTVVGGEDTDLINGFFDDIDIG